MRRSGGVERVLEAGVIGELVAARTVIGDPGWGRCDHHAAVEARPACGHLPEVERLHVDPALFLGTELRVRELRDPTRQPVDRRQGLLGVRGFEHE